MHKENIHVAISFSVMFIPIIIIAGIDILTDGFTIEEVKMSILIPIGLGFALLFYWTDKDKQKYYQTCVECIGTEKIKIIPKKGKVCCKICQGYGYHKKADYNSIQ